MEASVTQAERTHCRDPNGLPIARALASEHDRSVPSFCTGLTREHAASLTGPVGTSCVGLSEEGARAGTHIPKLIPPVGATWCCEAGRESVAVLADFKGP